MKIIVEQHSNYFLPVILFVFILFQAINPLGAVGVESNDSKISKEKSTHHENVPDLKFRNITGLNNNQVAEFCMDRFGFLWIGTLGGLHRYDGTEMVLYENHPDDSLSISYNRIDALFEDSKGNLWVGTANGICRYDRARDVFVRYEVKSHLVTKGNPNLNNILDINESASGVLWIASMREGLFYYDEALDAFEPYLVQSDLEVINTLQFSAIDFDMNGKMWVGTFDQGVYLLDLKVHEFVSFGPMADAPFPAIKSLRINDIVVQDEHNVWVGTDDLGIFKIVNNNANHVVQHYANDPRDKHSLKNNDISSLYKDRIGRIWSCNENGGLHLYDPEIDGFHRYLPDLDDPKSLSGISIWTALEDDQGRFWVGNGLTGVDVFDPLYERIDHHTVSPNGLSSDIVRAFHEDEHGNIWIATDGGGVNYFDRKTRKFTKYRAGNGNKGPSVDAVIWIEEAMNGDLWLGTWAGGVNILNPKTKTFRTLDVPEDIENFSVFQIARDNDGNMWMATFGEGLVMYDWEEKIFKIYKNELENKKSLTGDYLYSVTIDSKDNVWGGVRDGGVVLLTRENRAEGIFDRFTPVDEDPLSLPSYSISQVYEDSRKNLLVATDKGLRMYNWSTERFEAYGRQAGFFDDNIRSIIEDDRGMLWVRNMEGIVRYDPLSGNYRNYTNADGFQKGSYLIHTSYKTSKGELMVAGLKGFNVFHPDKMVANTSIPPVYLTDFKIHNEHVDVLTDTTHLNGHIFQAGEINLTHKDWKVEFEFVVINYTRSVNNQYAYMMEGLEEDWSYVGNQRSATYTNLPPGTYTFRVKAANGEGVWNNEGASIIVNVTSPWYKTSWAYFIGLILVILLITFGIRIRTYRLSLSRNKLEKLVHERTRELKEKHKEIMGQALELQRKNEELGLLNESISMQAEELRTYNDALNEMNENLEKMVEKRTRRLQQKNTELTKYSFANAHNVRGPLTRIMGLIGLANVHVKSDEVKELLARITEATDEMDQITRNIGAELDRQVSKA